MRLVELDGEVVELRKVLKVRGSKVISLPRLVLRLWGEPEELIVRTDLEGRRIILELPEGRVDKARLNT